MSAHIDVLIRTKRKTISINITPQGNVVVRAPIKCSNEKILNIVKEKEDWILLHQKRIQDNLSIHKDLISIKQVMVLGETYPILFDNEIKKISLVDNYIKVPYKFINPKSLQRNLAKWLQYIALNIIGERVKYFSTLMQLEYKTFSLMNSKRNWGICDLESNIKINWRLIMLPHSLIDYVVVHELAHILEFNHSKNFWLIVKSIISNYKECRNQLRKGDFLLQIFR